MCRLFAFRFRGLRCALPRNIRGHNVVQLRPHGFRAVINYEGAALNDDNGNLLASVRERDAEVIVTALFRGPPAAFAGDGGVEFHVSF